MNIQNLENNWIWNDQFLANFQTVWYWTASKILTILFGFRTIKSVGKQNIITAQTEWFRLDFRRFYFSFLDNWALKPEFLKSDAFGFQTYLLEVLRPEHSKSERAEIRKLKSFDFGAFPISAFHYIIRKHFNSIWIIAE